jgi:rhodanese-related sulfurtransferase
MKRYMDLVAEALPHVRELFPWDLQEELETGKPILLLDVREPYEFDTLHIEGALNVPRGVLEPACEAGYEESRPELVEGRDKEVVVICRSGHRSVLAAYTMQQMGFKSARSLKTGIRGWNDYELPCVDADGQPVSIDDADAYFSPPS